MRVNRVDIVQTHEFFAGTLGRLAAIIAKVPVIILMVHNCDLWKNRLHQTVDRLLANYTDAIISNSKSVMDFYIQFESINPSKIKTIYNGIDLSRFHHLINTDGKIKELNIEENYPIICVTGRMADQKGYKYLIKAIPQVIKEFPQMKMLIIGGGGVSSETTEEEIKDLVKRLYLKKFVHFLGWRADVTEILAICDLFVLPSLWEGFGLSIVEAMAAGKTVVATNVDAIPEVVSDGETGILVPPKDPNALANAIITLLEDPEKMRKMGQSGKKRAFDLFSAKRMTKDFEKLYLSLYNKNNMLIT
ncbi:MAG: GT4 family glycosyltransferase PelF [Bacteroidetes bacterium]|nr:GT4 family glycosyltransferase PelF [Bacteroidota bacterium]